MYLNLKRLKLLTLLKMSTFDSLVIVRIILRHLIHVLILELVLVVKSASVHIVHSSSIVEVSATSHSHVILASSSPEIASSTPEVVLLHTTSSSSILVILVVTVLPLNRFESNHHLLGRHWIVRLSELSISVCKMTFITKDTILMRLVMSAPVSLVFLIDLILLRLGELIIHLLALIHILHHIELVWLNEAHLLVELSRVWLLHHIILRIVSHLVLHHVHLSWELPLVLVPLLALYHLIWHLLLAYHLIHVHVWHLWRGIILHHHGILLHCLLNLHI